jgi:alpha-D-xyloside xylohydrolase
MRFGNGAWTMLPGVKPNYLGRVDAVEIRDRELIIHVGSRLETARWATLEGHMFTVRVTSPARNVLRVQVGHHKGRQRRGPEFLLNSAPRPLQVEESDAQVTASIDDLKLLVKKERWSLQFVDATSGKPITASPFKGMGLMEEPTHGVFMREQLTLKVGEQVYGLGERFAALTRNGQSVDMWNSDCGTCSDKGYKDVPFFLTSEGYGVLVNTPAKVSFEVGTEQVMRAQFAVPGEDLDYFLIYGPTAKDVLARLGELSGRPALPPVWSFGLWLTTSFTTDYDEPTVMEHIDGMRDRQLPLHVFHFDCFWMKGHHWCNFRWDEDVFPDPQGMLERLKQRGLHICVWINPYIGERSHLFDEGLEHGYLLHRTNGDVFQRDKWQAGMAYVDFTNPEATKWFQAQLRNLLRMGVDAFKTDFGEEIPTDVVYFDGSDPERMHNYYTYLYNQAVFDLLVQERGAQEAVVFARSATATCQKFPVHWGGDCYGTYESMAESLRGGLSLTLSGFGFWSHDIGGFETQSSAAVYKRWVAFGLLSSHSRLHGSTSYRVPWLYDEEAVDVVRYFTQLKCRLMPYLMRAAVEAHQASVPVMRAMMLEFPDDPTCRTLDRQYLLGDALLVAPVFHDCRAEFYLPAGTWTHLLTGEVREGGRWFFDDLGFLDVPLWIRANAVVPLGPEVQQVDYDFAPHVRLVCGTLDGETPIAVEIVDRNGEPATRFAVEQDGQRLTVTSLDGRSDFQIHLPWAKAVTDLQGGQLCSPDSQPAPRPGDSGGVLVGASGNRVSMVWS